MATVERRPNGNKMTRNEVISPKSHNNLTQTTNCLQRDKIKTKQKEWKSCEYFRLISHPIFTFLQFANTWQTRNADTQFDYSVSVTISRDLAVCRASASFALDSCENRSKKTNRRRRQKSVRVFCLFFFLHFLHANRMKRMTAKSVNIVCGLHFESFAQMSMWVETRTPRRYDISMSTNCLHLFSRLTMIASTSATAFCLRCCWLCHRSIDFVFLLHFSLLILCMVSTTSCHLLFVLLAFLLAFGLSFSFRRTRVCLRFDVCDVLVHASLTLHAFLSSAFVAFAQHQNCYGRCLPKRKSNKSKKNARANRKQATNETKEFCRRFDSFGSLTLSVVLALHYRHRWWITFFTISWFSCSLDIFSSISVLFHFRQNWYRIHKRGLVLQQPHNQRVNWATCRVSVKRI